MYMKYLHFITHQMTLEVIDMSCDLSRRSECLAQKPHREIISKSMRIQSLYRDKWSYGNVQLIYPPISHIPHVDREDADGWQYP